MSSSPAQMAKQNTSQPGTSRRGHNQRPPHSTEQATTANPVRLRCQHPGGEDGITDLSRTLRVTKLLGLI